MCTCTYVGMYVGSSSITLLVSSLEDGLYENTPIPYCDGQSEIQVSPVAVIAILINYLTALRCGFYSTIYEGVCWLH